ncbi:MAG: hypothetical protein KA746_11215 [Pyrinomonadaceae bacterium]|nr:hypothetical protein [Pyrinomonadaceae bacterium]MBP6212618.1 hypothetical protein [Pyrinomonadaceae bacterium]
MNEPDDDIKKPDEYETIVEGVDYYFEDGMMVLTGRYLLARGKCCGNGCRHCPFENGRKLK